MHLKNQLKFLALFNLKFFTELDTKRYRRCYSCPNNAYGFRNSLCFFFFFLIFIFLFNVFYSGATWNPHGKWEHQGWDGQHCGPASPVCARSWDWPSASTHTKQRRPPNVRERSQCPWKQKKWDNRDKEVGRTDASHIWFPCIWKFSWGKYELLETFCIFISLIILIQHFT